VQRDARWWNVPDAFDPDRFLPEAKVARPKYAYFPFGGGGRQCIGEGLAWMEGTLALASMAQDWRFVRIDGEPTEMKIDPSISLRPKGPVMLRVERRWKNSC
jgi:cytochrome P450